MIKMFSWFALGVLVGYVIQLKRNIQLYEKLEAATKSPLKPTREDWWENNKPDTDDEYTLTKARHDWLQGFFVKYVYPYVHDTTGSFLIHEFLMPLNERLTHLELEMRNTERAFQLMAKRRNDVEQ